MIVLAAAPVPSAQQALIDALTRFLATSSCPKYLHDAAAAWLAQT